MATVKNGITKSLRRVERELPRVAPQLHKFWVGITPRRSGNARRKTSLKNNRTIVANYPYAQRLDQGWSRQAPNGMSRPTERLMKRIIKRIIRK